MKGKGKAHADVVRVGKDLLKAIQALKAVQLTVRGVGKITAHAEKNAREQHEVYGRDAWRRAENAAFVTWDAANRVQESLEDAVSGLVEGRKSFEKYGRAEGAARMQMKKIPRAKVQRQTAGAVEKTRAVAGSATPTVEIPVFSVPQSAPAQAGGEPSGEAGTGAGATT